MRLARVVAAASAAAACGGAAFTAAVGAGSDAGSDANVARDAGARDAEIDNWVAPVCDGGQNFQSDPKNCGRCGHDCTGGACAAGVCQPVKVASGARVTGVALVGSELYYMEQDTGQMRHLTLPGGTAQPVGTPVAAGGGYFTIPQGASYALVRTPSQIMRLSLSGGSPQQVLGSLSGGYGIASDGNVMYWVENDAMKRASVDGGGVAPFGDGGLTNPEQLVLAQNVVGVADLGNNRLVYVDRTSGALTVFKSGLGSPAGLAPEGQNVYTTLQFGDQQVALVDGTTRAVTKIASAEMPTGIAVNGRWIVWGFAGGTGGVMLLAK